MLHAGRELLVEEYGNAELAYKAVVNGVMPVCRYENDCRGDGMLTVTAKAPPASTVLGGVIVTEMGCNVILTEVLVS